MLRARFNDARFFWQTDQKNPLRERLGWLKNVTFQKDLGSYYDKTLRVQRLCSWLCEKFCKQRGIAVRPGVVHKAALLSKTDLTTELVKEFTELQGIVGGLVRRGAGTRSRACRMRRAGHRRRDLRSLQARVDGRLGSADRRRRGALDRRQGRQHCRNVRAGTSVRGFERSVCAAPPGQRNRQDDCGTEAAAQSGRVVQGCARRRIRGLRPRRSLSPA